MRYLLDTHIWLWFSSDPERISESVRRAILDANSEVWISAASVWELAIKVSLGKLSLPSSVPEFVRDRGELAGFRMLSIHPEHAVTVTGLPHHHNDPFDRMLVAQAKAESLTLVTADEKLRAYSVPLVWAPR